MSLFIESIVLGPHKREKNRNGRAKTPCQRQNIYVNVNRRGKTKIIITVKEHMKRHVRKRNLPPLKKDCSNCSKSNTQKETKINSKTSKK